MTDNTHDKNHKKSRYDKITPAYNWVFTDYFSSIIFTVFTV
jgi:hypothetical protein